MIDFELLKDKGILVLHPTGPLSVDDFRRISEAVDPHILENGKLNGLLIEASGFPGWTNFDAFIDHLKFVKDHHRKIERVAIVTDDGVLRLAPRIAEHFAHPAFKVFGSSDADRAFAWLQAETGP